jgi:hypothetical protein
LRREGRVPILEEPKLGSADASPGGVVIEDVRLALTPKVGVADGAAV